MLFFDGFKIIIFLWILCCVILMYYPVYVITKWLDLDPMWSTGLMFAYVWAVLVHGWHRLMNMLK